MDNRLLSSYFFFFVTRLANFYYERSERNFFLEITNIRLNRMENQFLGGCSSFVSVKKFYKHAVDNIIDNHRLTVAVTRARIIKPRGDNN